jgi:uncharacterized protein with PIN domain
MRFIADEMLGKLARWLRLAGYDTLYCNPVADEELLEVARRDGRIILTRDRKLGPGAESHRVVLVGSENPFEQFVFVVRQFQLDIESRAFQRCLECNGELVTVRKDDYEDRIPPHVYKTQTSFSRCSSCDRLYWPGTHYESMRKRLALAKKPC